MQISSALQNINNCTVTLLSKSYDGAKDASNKQLVQVILSHYSIQLYMVCWFVFDSSPSHFDYCEVHTGHQSLQSG